MANNDYMRITISFKRDEKPLYEHIKTYSSPTGHIKDLLKRELEQQKALQKEGHKGGM